MKDTWSTTGAGVTGSAEGVSARSSTGAAASGVGVARGVSVQAGSRLSWATGAMGATRATGSESPSARTGSLRAGVVRKAGGAIDAEASAAASAAARSWVNVVATAAAAGAPVSSRAFAGDAGGEAEHGSAGRASGGQAHGALILVRGRASTAFRPRRPGRPGISRPCGRS